jgi:hypothetical protein
MKDEKKEYYTNSVLNFLKESPELVYEYLDDANGEGRTVSYSDMLRVILNGTTKEGVNFASRFVVRGKITKYLEGVNNEYRARKI